jgi:hypothetical protein
MPDPFINTEDLSNLLGIDVTTDPGALIAIDAACDLVRDYTMQDFNYGTTTVSLDGTDTDALVLPQQPAANCGTVVIANQGTITDYMLGEANRLLRGTAGAGGVGTRPFWPRGRQNITVTYEHGFLPDDLPRSVRMVALSIATRIVVQGVAESETVGDVSISYGGRAGEITAGEKNVLDGWVFRRSY